MYLYIIKQSLSSAPINNQFYPTFILPSESAQFAVNGSKCAVRIDGEVVSLPLENVTLNEKFIPSFLVPANAYIFNGIVNKHYTRYVQDLQKSFVEQQDELKTLKASEDKESRSYVSSVNRISNMMDLIVNYWDGYREHYAFSHQKELGNRGMLPSGSLESYLPMLWLGWGRNEQTRAGYASVEYALRRTIVNPLPDYLKTA